MKKTCEELLIYINQAAIEIQAKKSLKEAKTLYKHRKFDGALVHLSHAYALGSIDAVKNLRAVIKRKEFGYLKPRDFKKSTFFIFDLFELIRGQDYKKLPKIADTLFYGFSFENKIFERFRNSLKFYKGSWKVNKDYYSLYSIGKLIHDIIFRLYAGEWNGD